MTRLERWAYRQLLRLFPPGFRGEFGGDMERLFRDRLAETGGRPTARGWLWITAVADVGSGAAAEWGRAIASTARTLRREGGSMGGWRQDLRFGIRSLSRRPGFTAAATVTLALGVGATVAIFSVVNGVLLKPLPFPDADDLVVLWAVDSSDGTRGSAVDHPDVRAWQAEVAGFSVAGLARSRPTLTGLGGPEVILAERVTDGLIGLFGFEPTLGRDLTAEDDVPGGPTVAVVSHAFWVERLGADPNVLGTTITLSGTPWEIVGVGPPGFDYPNGTVVWMPRRHDPDGCSHGCRIMTAVGRIHPPATLEQIQQRFDAVSLSLGEQFPDEHATERIELERMLDREVADVRVALWVLMGAVAMVLLIACANVANLLMVRAADRAGEVALRWTLGAGRIRIVRQLLTESLLLSGLGGALGLGMAAWGTAAVVALSPPDIPRLEEVGLNGTVLAFALVVVLGVTAAFGLAPALKLTGRPLQGVLTGSRRTHGGRRTALSRSLLLSTEVALSLTLLLGAGLLFGTLREMRAVDLGFATERVERFRLSVPGARYDSEGVVRFLAELEQRLTELPEVEVAGTIFGAPLASGNIFTSADVLDRPAGIPQDEVDLDIRPSSPGYLDAIGIPLEKGRWIEPGDVRSVGAVAVINRATADRLYPDADPIGRQIRLHSSWGYDDEPVRTIVGVVGNVRTQSAVREDDPAVYVPNAQFAASSTYVTMRLRPGSPSAIPGAREVLQELDPEMAMTTVERIEDVVARELAPTTFYLTLLAAFSLLALVLAAVGLYGVVAYAVSRRTREIGIRVALGARAESVVGMVVREGLAPAITGVVVGLFGSWMAARALSSLLYGVRPNDPATMLCVTAVLLGVSILATVMPARRATRVSPAVALRDE